MTPRAWLRAGATVLVSTLALAPAAPASASPKLDDARHRAAALRQAVDKLTVRAEAATEDFNAASDQLAKAVTARLLAQAAVDRAESAQQADAGVAGARVRAIYMSGGTMAMYATVLSAVDLHDAFSRIAYVKAVVSHDGSARHSADTTLAQSKAAAQRLRDVALRQTRLEKVVATATDRVRRALAEQQALLANADATVLQIAEADRIAAEQAAQRAFRARLATARGISYVDGALLDSLRNDTTAPPTPRAATAIAAARSQLGKPYQWGATGPATFDCSGLTGWAYHQAGVELPRTSREQWGTGPHPSLADLAPGDLLFWGTDPANPQSIHHVALYVGGGRMIAAPHTGGNVQEQPVYLGDFFGVTRPG